MESLKQYIIEKLSINKNTKVKNYTYFPKDKNELINIIVEKITKAHEEDENIMDFDLNDIDTSKIDDMYKLFPSIKQKVSFKNVNVSDWNVSNVKSFNNCFCGMYNFNCDLSDWNISSGEDFESMFEGCYSFNSDLKNWNFENAKFLKFMFLYCYDFDTDVSNWDLSNASTITRIFDSCRSFKGVGLDKMKVSKSVIENKRNSYQAFYRCYNIKKLPSWYEES